MLQYILTDLVIKTMEDKIPKKRVGVSVMLAANTINFSDNVIYIYFLACIVILGYDKFIKKQKIVLIYATTIAMELLSSSSFSFFFMLGLLLICMFMLEEYLCDDYVKQEILRRFFPHKVLDFIYEFIVLDGGIFIIFNLFLASDYGKYWLIEQFKVATKLFYLINAGMLLVSIHMFFSSKFAIKSFSEMKRYFDKLVSYNLHVNDPEVQKKFEILIGLEDQSYFIRKESYNWLSAAFIKYRRERRNKVRDKKKRKINLKLLIKKVKKIGIRKAICRLKDKIETEIICRKNIWRKIRGKIRGCSTLEMQLIRQIGIQKGYEECVIRRKAFEIIYSFIFFSGLKEYYKESNCAKYAQFKEFLLYVYLYSVRVTVKTEGNSEIFDPIASAFVDLKADMENYSIADWDIDKFFVLMLGLPNAKVGLKRLLLYPQIVIAQGICLENAYTWLQVIKDGQYKRTLTKKEHLFKKRKKAVFRKIPRPFYRIGNHFLPYIQDGIIYGPQHGPSYGEDNCWQFAQNVYSFLGMGEGWFSSEAGTSADYLRNIQSLEDRTITPDHTKQLLINSPAGSVIRIADDIRGNDTNGKKKHSQILVKTSTNGLVVYDSNNEETGFQYYTWKEYAEVFKDYKYFKYIK